MVTCLHCAVDFMPKPRRNRHGVIGEPQSARFCSDRCRQRAHRARTRVLGSVQNAVSRCVGAPPEPVTALDRGMYPQLQMSVKRL
jgi:hypothetical protein